jgi:hypothetical protein
LNATNSAALPCADLALSQPMTGSFCCARRNRPSRCRIAENGDERAPPHDRILPHGGIGPVSHAPQQTGLFDQLVGASLKRQWYGNSERPSGLEVNNEIEFDRNLDRQVRWFGTSQDAIHLRSCSVKEIAEAWPI